MSQQKVLNPTIAWAHNKAEPADSEPPREADRDTWPFWAVGILVLLIGLKRLSIPRDVILEDSPAFDQAFNDWFPLIEEKPRTPRELKRLVNRLRYYAMRVRQQGETGGVSRPSRLERFANSVKTIRSSRETPPGMEVELSRAEKAVVALGVVEFAHPEWLCEDFYRDPAGYMLKHEIFHMPERVEPFAKDDRDLFDAIRSGVRFGP